jgi:peroxiredoxin
MNKKVSVVLWIVAIFMLLAASYTIYIKYAPQSNTQLQSQKNAPISESNPQKFLKKVMAPDFTLKDLDGQNVNLSDYRGKIVILNFWAVWCKYCKEEMPDLNELNKILQKENDAVILAVDSEEKPEVVKKYLSDNKINLHVLLDQSGAVTRTYGIEGFPTTFIINRDGSVYTYIPGATNKETLMEILDSVRKEESVK